MKIEYRQARIDDAEQLVNIYNASFYDDYIRFGSCPGYGQTKEMMEESIGKYLKHIILCDNEPVGCVSCIKLAKGVYEVGCLCVIPEYQGKGVGRILINELLKYVNDNGIKNTDIYVELCAMPEVAEFYKKCGFDSNDGIRLKMWYEVK